MNSFFQPRGTRGNDPRRTADDTNVWGRGQQAQGQRPNNWVSAAGGNQGMGPGGGDVAGWANRYGKSNMSQLQNFHDAQRAQAERGFKEGPLGGLNSAFNNAGRTGGASHALATGKAWGDYQSNIDASQAGQKWQAMNDETSRDYGGFMQDRGWAHDASQRAADRSWQTGEREGTQAWQTSEGDKGRSWQTGERIGAQDWGTGERKDTQGWQTSEREGSQAWQTGEREGSQAWQGDQNQQDRGLTREGWQFQSDERQSDRDFSQSERESSQGWQGDQRQDDRDWQSGENQDARDFTREGWEDQATREETQRSWQKGENELQRTLNAKGLKLEDKKHMWQRSMDSWQRGLIDAQQILETEQGRQFRDDMMAMDKQKWSNMNEETQRQYLQMSTMMLSNPGLDENFRSKIMDTLLQVGGNVAVHELTKDRP